MRSIALLHILSQICSFLSTSSAPALTQATTSLSWSCLSAVMATTHPSSLPQHIPHSTRQPQTITTALVTLCVYSLIPPLQCKLEGGRHCFGGLNFFTLHPRHRANVNESLLNQLIDESTNLPLITRRHHKILKYNKLRLENARCAFFPELMIGSPQSCFHTGIFFWKLPLSI